MFLLGVSGLSLVSWVLHSDWFLAADEASLRLVLMTRREGIGRRGCDVGGDRHINVLSQFYVFYAFYLPTISPHDIQACFELPQRGASLKRRTLDGPFEGFEVNAVGW